MTIASDPTMDALRQVLRHEGADELYLVRRQLAETQRELAVLRDCIHNALRIIRYLPEDEGADPLTAHLRIIHNTTGVLLGVPDASIRGVLQIHGLRRIIDSTQAVLPGILDENTQAVLHRLPERRFHRI